MLLVGCATTQSPEPPTAKAPDFSINQPVFDGNIETVKQHLAAGTDVNTKDDNGWTPLHLAVDGGHIETADLLRKQGGKTSEELEAEGK